MLQTLCTHGGNMKKLFISIAVLFFILALPASASAKPEPSDLAPFVTEVSKIWARFTANADDWTAVEPDMYSHPTSEMDADYPLDYEKMLAYMKTVFTDKLASDMLHRKDSGLFYRDGKLYQHGGWVALISSPLVYDKNEEYHELTTPTPPEQVKIISSDSTIATAEIRCFRRQYGCDDSVKPRITEYKGTLTFAKTENGWRVTGGTLMRKLFRNYPVYSYDPADPQNPPTGSSFPVAFAVTAAAASTIIPLLRKKRKNPA